MKKLMCVSVSEYCDTQKTQVKKTGLEASEEIKHFHLSSQAYYHLDAPKEQEHAITNSLKF